MSEKVGIKKNWIFIIIGSIVLFAISLTAGIVTHTNSAKDDSSKNCNCIAPSDKGWRSFSAVFIALGIPFFVLTLFFGFSDMGKVAGKKLGQTISSAEFLKFKKN